MKHLIVGLFFVLSILAISMHYRVVRINVRLLHKNAWKIVEWVAGILLTTIVSSWLK